MSLSRASLIFSINCFVAAMLALWIALSIGLPRPYWAMLTVYIVSQPLTGALRSKAFYRVIGTITGGVAAVAIVPTFVNAPPLMSLAMAAWVGVCLYVSLLDRTPRAYVFMLAGYTAAIIGFPSVAAPAEVFETAVSRVEEITLGIVCATLVHTIVFPRDVGRVLSARVAAFLEDSQVWIRDALTFGANPVERGERRRLAADITELHIAATHLPFDTGNLPLRVNTVRVLETRLAYMLPLISALEDRLAQLGDLDSALGELLADTVAWTLDADTEGADRLSERCRRMTPLIDARSDWRDLLTVSVLVRLEELIQALRDSRALAHLIAGERTAVGERLQRLLRQRRRRRLHLDHGMAALSGLSLMVATLFCCGLWIVTAWPEGAVAATMAAVFSAFFAAQDDPAPAIGRFMTWTILALPAAALYLFLVLPRIDGFPVLVLALAPALMVIGYFQGLPRSNSAALAFLLGFVGGLALQERFSAALPEFLNANLAQLVGIGSALATTRLMRSVGAGWAAHRILRRSWRDIAALARGQRPTDADSWTSLMLDRVGLVTSRIALSEPEAGFDGQDGAADMRVGLNLIGLRTLVSRVEGEVARAVDGALHAVAATFDRRIVSGNGDVDPGLLGAIDRSIETLAAAGDPDPGQSGFAALVGLRRNLLPTAPAFERRAA